MAQGVLPFKYEAEKKTTGMTAIRYWLINVPGRIVNRSPSLIIRLTSQHPSLELLIEARRKIAMLKAAGCG